MIEKQQQNQATCIHDSYACIAWLTEYACSISGVLNYIYTKLPAPEQGSGAALFRVSV